MAEGGHPPRGELLLLHSGELDVETAREVSAHLERCPECRTKWAGLEQTFQAVVDSGVEASGKGGTGRGARAAVATTLALALTVYFLTKGTPEARADELLAGAAAVEAAGKDAPRRFRLRAGAEECVVAPGAWAWRQAGAGGGFCASAISVMSEAGWAPGELLSAERFQAWRGGLREKSDAVEETASWVEVTTATAEGPLLHASLRLRASDFRPQAARYQPAGMEAFEVEAPADVAEDVVEPVQPEREAEEPIAPAVLGARLEAEVRLALRRLDADRSVLLDVERVSDGAGVRVWGVAASGEMKRRIEERLAGVDGVVLAIASEAEQRVEERPVPWDGFHEMGPALAADEVGDLFRNDLEGRERFLRELGVAARELAGAARAREGLVRLVDLVDDGELAGEVGEAAGSLDRPVEVAARRLSVELAPLFEELGVEAARVSGTESLGYAEAAEIYTLVCRLTLGAAPERGDSIELTVGRLHALLGG